MFDPVMVATSGDMLADDATIAAFGRLMRIARVTTPNLPELKRLSGMSTLERAAVEAAGSAVADRTGRSVLVKGGHARGRAVTDRLISPAAYELPIVTWSDPRIDGTSTHGTGCTLASAIACGLASGWDLPEAITRARVFVRLAIRDAADLGKGHGPMAHQSVRLDLPVEPVMPILNHITLPMDDLAASERFYRLLGFHQIVRAEPRYARFENDAGMTLSIEVAQEIGNAPIVYLECDDLDPMIELLTHHGVSVAPAVDQNWGWREARLADPAGNAICLYQAGENRRYPAWRLRSCRV